MHPSLFHTKRNPTLMGFHGPYPSRFFWWIIDSFSPIRNIIPMINDIRAKLTNLFNRLFIFKSALIGIYRKCEIIKIRLLYGFSYPVLVFTFLIAKGSINSLLNMIGIQLMQ